MYQFALSNDWPCEVPGTTPPWECRERRPTTRLQQAFANATTLASRAGKPFFPGLMFQLFHAPARVEPLCDQAISFEDPAHGYIPLARWSEGRDVPGRSRLAMRAVLQAAENLRPRVVLMTPYNEPGEGTMIAPTDSANAEGYTMGMDFFTQLRDVFGN